MTKILVVVESPAKAKTIGKYLGKKYTVRASMGHIRDLPKSQFGVDVENDFLVKYITIRGKGDLLRELKTLAQKSDEILLATDPDREGEAIAWHLQEFLKLPADKECRVEFNEITKNKIIEAIKKPRQIDQNRVDAQQTRRVLDRIVGYKLSPLLWRKIKKGLSAGRVQSVVVRLICDRENEINSFTPEEYWSLTAKLAKGKGSFAAELSKISGKKAELKNEEQVQEIIRKIQHQPFLVEAIKKKEQKKNPAPPFITSTLQQEASRKLNYTAKKTMMIAQQLYEGIELSKKEGSVGLITYMRTDSTRISDEAKQETRNYIETVFGKAYLAEGNRNYVSKGKIQNAHECIRPTSTFRDPQAVREYLKPEQYKLYKLIWERFVASQMAAVTLEVTSVDLTALDYLFKATGSVVIFPGFTKLYVEGSDDKESKEEYGKLPALQEKEEVALQELIPKQHFTQPPSRYSEATLIKTLEEKGIGRPSTYAPILDTIVSRGYVVKEKKQYVPTDLGFLVIDLLKKYFPEIIDLEFTANLENNLDSIEEGQSDWKAVLGRFFAPFNEELKIADQEIGQIEIADEVSEEICEKCGRNLVIKQGRFGKFLACPGFPECRNTKPLLQKTGIRCAKCGEGTIVARRTKKGRKFFGCSNYPQCDFVSWDEPVNKTCPQCQQLLVLKKNQKEGDKYVCTGENCKYTEKAEQER
ncbi:MAG: type I DNA topoisomerase [Peptococcia bacterium]